MLRGTQLLPDQTEWFDQTEEQQSIVDLAVLLFSTQLAQLVSLGVHFCPV